MTDVTIKRLEELEPFYHDSFLRLRAALGVQAFGMQIITLASHSDLYPEHDHTENGQEEVYITLAGRATLFVAGESYTLEPDVFVRVGPGERRKVVTANEGVQLVVVGGTPGQPYTPPPYTDSGAALAVATAAPTTATLGQIVNFDASDSTAGQAGNSLVPPNYFVIVDGRGMYFLINGTYQATSPAFMHAAKACGVQL